MLDRFYNQRSIQDLIGKRISEVTGLFVGSTCIEIKCDDGSKYKMYHEQDFDEDVMVSHIKTIRRDETSLHTPEQILSGPVFMAVEATDPLDDKWLEHRFSCRTKSGIELGFCIDISAQLTFFNIMTIEGVVEIIWQGFAPNRETSVEVDFVQTDGPGV